MMVDPDGELAWFVPIIVGAVVNTMVQGVAGNLDNFGDLALSLGIGALAGAAGVGAGQLVSGALGASSTLGGSVINGALTGAAGGFAGGFVGGAGNAWAGGASREEGLESGFKTGEYGAITGAAIGGISGGIRHNKQMLTFRKGNAELGIQSDEAVPATDDFLNDARKAWFPDKSMDNIKSFTVENVPEKTLNRMKLNGASGSTQAYVKTIDGVKYFNGRSSIYFNSEISHTSAKRLFFTMGHEFVHASQYSVLAGAVYTSEFHVAITEVLEFHAYSFENTVLGSSNYVGFTPQMARELATTFPEYFKTLNYTNFSWTKSTNFIYPFK